MLQKIKVLLGITDTSKDDLLSILIDQCTDHVIMYTHNPDCIAVLGATIMEMVVYCYNRIGTEGLNSESYSGVNFSYAADYPESVLRALRAHRKARFK